MKKAKKIRTNEQIAMMVSWISIVINLLLSTFKFIAGIVANSSAMIADAVHSVSDGATTVIVMIGIKMSNKASDKEHQYGHERMECVAALILSIILFAVGMGIGYAGVMKIISAEVIPVPGQLALIAAIASIAIKEAMYWYTRIAAKKINSTALMADAWHHRSDGLSSIGSFAGILGARLGYPVLDPVACLIICVFIVKVSYDIFKEAIGKMTDRACDEKTIEEIRAIVYENEGVLGIDKLKTRIFGDKIYIDIEISADGSLPLRKAHDIAEGIHDAIEGSIKNVKHCMVHINPGVCEKR